MTQYVFGHRWKQRKRCGQSLKDARDWRFISMLFHSWYGLPTE